MDPMLGREVVKREQHVSILLKTFARFGIFRGIFFKEGVKRFVGVFTSLRHPNLMDV